MKAGGRHAGAAALLAIPALALVFAACGGQDAATITPAPAPTSDAAAAVDTGTPPPPPTPDAGNPDDGGVVFEPLPTDLPAALVAKLSVKPYVEETCVDATYTGFPYPGVKQCTYNGGLKVTVADPIPGRVAAWIVDSATLIDTVASLKTRDPASYEAALLVIAGNVLGQSSRIFPLTGQVDEGTVYTFEKGVTKTCTTGCFCRINSTSRQMWCSYAAAVRGEVEADCLARFGTQTFTTSWADFCLANHVAAWPKNRNETFRARAYVANTTLKARFPTPATAAAAEVIAALKTIFPP